MDATTGVAIAALPISLIALLYTGITAVAARRSAAAAADRSAAAADQQTAIQRQIRIDSAQPYVWVDVRPDEGTGTIMNLVIGNSGPTVARNVRARIEPPFPSIEQLREGADTAHQRLEEGLSSMPPGRVLTWSLGQGWNILKEGGPQAHTVTITADGPFGSVPPLTYIVDLADWREALDRPAGNLHLLTKAVTDLTKKIGS